jgi:transcriptional regulator with XRE-family HTH domain
MDHWNVIPQWLRAKRLESSLSQADVGIQIGRSGPTIGNWERGKCLPSEQDLSALVNIFGPMDESEDVVDGSELGQWLRSERINQKLSIQQMSDISGVSAPTIRNIENGRNTTPHVSTIEKLEQGLQLAYVRTLEPASESLVKEFLPVGDLQGFDPYNEETWPVEPGIYFLKLRTGAPCYVGEGQCISKRLREHYQKHWYRSPTVESAAYMKVEDRMTRKSLEKTLIQLLSRDLLVNKQHILEERREFERGLLIT